MTTGLVLAVIFVLVLWSLRTLLRSLINSERVNRHQPPPGFGLTRGRAALRHQLGHLEVAGLNGTATFLFLYIFLYKIRYSEVRYRQLEMSEVHFLS